MEAWVLRPIVQAVQQPLLYQCLAAGVVGILAHLLYFIHWTADTAALNVACVQIFGSFFVLGIEVLARGLVALLASVFIYRVFFHPLRHFPGPFWAKVTKMYGIYCARNNKLHEEYDARLQEYGGDFVRIGPNELLHNSIDCMTQVHGPQSKCVKDNQYTVVEYGPHRCLNLAAMPDKTDHRYRRQVWDKAFNGKAFDAREQPIRSTILEWLSKVDEYNGKPMNWTLFASLISFDVMSRVGFSVDFGGLRAGKESILQVYIQALFKNMIKIGQFPWLVSLFQRTRLPLSRDVANFEDLAKRLVKQRLEDKEAKEDIFHYFMDDFRSEKPKSFFTKEHLECDAQAILIGAADSSFSPMTFCLRHLILNPSVMETLRAELAPLYSKTHPGGFAHVDLAHAEHLNAVIDETMRLHNPTCTNGPRRTPPGGIVLSDKFIPGNVSLLSSIWSFHRSEKYFVKPLEWIPERWTTQQELVIDKRAFHPFSFGPFNCVGKRLAMMTLRMVLAYTVWFCDMEFAAGEDGTHVLAMSRDEIFLVPGPLFLVFKKRSGVNVEES
ncbi:Fc.00g007930.m01.CDS01 [Cosmosporella sp. VM-42]